MMFDEAESGMEIYEEEAGTHFGYKFTIIISEYLWMDTKIVMVCIQEIRGKNFLEFDIASVLEVYLTFS